MMRQSLGQEQLLLSTAKSACVYTDKETQKRLQALLRPGEPPVLSLVKNLGVDSAGARRRRVGTSNARLLKGGGQKRQSLPSSKCPTSANEHRSRPRVCSPLPLLVTRAKDSHLRRMKVLRAIAGGHFGKLAFSLDLVFDFSEVGTGDPMCKLIPEHWSMLQECVVRNLPAASPCQENLGSLLGQTGPQ